MAKYKVLGIMSGTSLDGLDLALCVFEQKQDKWFFDVEKTHTFDYPEFLQENLRQAQTFDALHLIELHKDYGEFIAECVNKFLLDVEEKPALIASHGHTILHLPEEGINFQAGDGAVISAQTGITTVCDFRSVDIALGGQGAPLVPMGDLLLFDQYDLMLNIGGFSNLTVKKEKIAYDIAPANFALNYFARSVGKEYDKDGELGKKGKVSQSLLQDLESIGYYSQQPPKSLSDHWFYSVFLPAIEKHDLEIFDVFSTLYEHISLRIASELSRWGGKAIITGGGAKNVFLIEKIKEKTEVSLILPSRQLIDYKEAVIFAFLGLLRYLGMPNTLASVTGAMRDSSGGAIYSS